MVGRCRRERTPRSFCCGLFCSLLRSAASDTAFSAVHEDDRFENAIVVRTGGCDVVARRAQRLLCRELLKASFVVLSPRALGAAGDVFNQEVEDDLRCSTPASVDEHGAEDRLEGISENRFFVAAARLIFATTQQHLRTNTNASSDVCEGRGIHHRRSQLRQLTLGQIVVHPVDVFGHGQPEYRIAKKLEPFIRLGGIRFRAVASMCQRKLQQRRVGELVPDRSGQLLGVGRLVQDSAPTWL